MFDEVRYWSAKEIARATAAIIALLFFVAASVFNRAEPTGNQVAGIVLSSGAIARGKAQGGTREAATVRLPSGRIVSAMVISGGPLSPGAHVTLLERARLVGGPTYDIIAADR
jgi:hypothetical protein